MNWYLVAGGVALAAIGLIHSVLGERRIFRRLRGASFIPTDGGSHLREPHVRILWATWHLATALSWGLAAILLWLALPSSQPLAQSPIPALIAAAVFASGGLVLIGTNDRHPGWIGLLGAAVLIWLA
ncbi:MAG TPA: hypothetical protein VGE07_18520 [Herpetosiphonaceae bacterium]